MTNSIIAGHQPAPAASAADERQVRVDLAAAYRLVALYGWDDLVFTHLSARVPGPDHHFLINPFALMFEEMTASALVKIDMHGRQVEGTPTLVNAAGFVIHSAIHMARPDAQAVLHLHTPYGQAVSAMSEGLMPHTQTAMIADAGIATHDYEGIATEPGERERLVADLGDQNLMLLRNHGTLTTGATVADAFVRMYFLERACAVQVHMLAAGRAGLCEPPAGMHERVLGQSAGEDATRVTRGLVWPALLRKLDRIDPGFRA